MSKINFYAVRNNLGQVDSIYRSQDGMQIPIAFDPVSKKFDEKDSGVIEFRAWVAENGELDLSDQPIDQVSLDQAKASKKQEIIAIAAAKQEELVAGFALPEQASWTRKVAEAKAFLSNGKLDESPMIKAEAIAICDSTKEPVIIQFAQSLAARVAQKSEQMYLDSANIAGKRSNLLSKVESAKTFEELNAIAWN